MTLRFRWLGVAGFELTCKGERLLADPFITRFPLRRVLLGRVQPQAEEVARRAPHADYILLSHAHWDHVLDAPEILRRGGVAYGSANTCRLLRASGVAPGQAIELPPEGGRLTLGPFQAQALPSQHITILGLPMQAGLLPADLRPPLRARDYRMDASYDFLIEVAGLRLLDWLSARADGAPRADVLLVKPFHRADYYRKLFAQVQPRLIVPIHWDRLTRPAWRRRAVAGEAPLPQRLNLWRFLRLAARLAPDARVMVPRVDEVVGLDGF